MYTGIQIHDNKLLSIGLLSFCFSTTTDPDSISRKWLYSTMLYANSTVTLQLC